MQLIRHREQVVKLRDGRNGHKYRTLFQFALLGLYGWPGISGSLIFQHHSSHKAHTLKQRLSQLRIPVAILFERRSTSDRHREEKLFRSVVQRARTPIGPL